MRSRLAQSLREELASRVRKMPPEERLAIALALGERAIGDYMRNFGVGRREAIAVLRRAGRAGRRPAACMEDPGESDPADRRRG